MKIPFLFGIAELYRMKVVIAAATGMELEQFRDSLSLYNNIELIYNITGVGAIAATYAIQKAIMESKTEMVMQVGIAGSFSEKFPLGEAFAIKNEMPAEMGVLEDGSFKDIFDLGLQARDQLPYTNGLLVNNNDALLEYSKLGLANGITVNEITTSPEKISRYTNRFNADIETMEGAALHHVCIMNKIPFIQIRGISNYVGVRNKDQWQIKNALDAALHGCQQVLKSLEKKS